MTKWPKSEELQADRSTSLPTTGDAASRLAAQILHSCAVEHFSFEQESCSLLLPIGVYRPDVWTQELLRGVRQQLANVPNPLVVVEVGIGSGVVPIFVDTWLGSDYSGVYIGLDVNEVALEASRLNLALAGVPMKVEFAPSGHLLETMPLDLLGRVDLVVANLPQVPIPEPDAGNFNDYYSPRILRSESGRLSMCGLGLVSELLDQVEPFLAPTGSLVITLAGRCSLDDIVAMFHSRGWEYLFLGKARVEQNPETRIDAFVGFEWQSGSSFRFYAEPEGPATIPAAAAWERIKGGSTVYHDLYVVRIRRASESQSGV